MKNISAYSVWVAALLGAGLGPAWATEPGGTAPAGKVLLLHNENVLQGDVDRVGDRYRVRRLFGETWVPASQVLRLCPTLDDAYQYLRGRANLRDPDERLRLANWCREHDLLPQALTEAEAAVQLRPTHAPSVRLLGHLREAVLRKPDAVKAGPRPDAPVPHVDLTADALGQFVTRVQPILMNACACCHTAGRGGKFQLTRSYEVNLANKRTLQQNLTAVLAQVNLREPQASPLLSKAISAHAGGMSQAPLRNRDARAYRMLEDWVRLTLAHNPQLSPGASAPAVSPEPAAAAPPAPASWGADRAAPAPPAPPGAPAPALAAPPPALAKPGPPDPVDPEEFNRQFHPRKETR
jgi:hypothetical protein